MRRPCAISASSWWHANTQGPALIDGSDADKIIADKAYDKDDFVAAIQSRDAEAVIPPRSNRLEQRDYDKEEYKKRFQLPLLPSGRWQGARS